MGDWLESGTFMRIIEAYAWGDERETGTSEVAGSKIGIAVKNGDGSLFD